MSINSLLFIVLSTLSGMLVSCGSKESPQPGQSPLPFPELRELESSEDDIAVGPSEPVDKSLVAGIPCCVGEIRVGSFNLESGNAEISFLLSDMRKFGLDVDIWGFQEVSTNWFDPILDGLEELNKMQFHGVMSRSGGEDRLMIAYNASRLRLDSYQELGWINLNRRGRAPLVAKFTVIETGLQFVFVNNHLYRANEAGRHDQARLLNEWGQQQQLPTIAVGDYNFDWDVSGLGRDLGYDLLTQQETFVWIKPQELIKTQCSPHYNAVLDFVFLGGAAQVWQASSKIKFHEPEYCNRNPWRSDHRPVTALFLPIAM